MHIRLLFVGALAVHALAACVSAQNWTSFRGPNGSGVGTGTPPVNWNVESGENIRWKTPIPGLAHSSPVVWGERVFLTTAVPAGDAEPVLKTGWMGGSGAPAKDNESWTWQVLCLDKRDGKVVWTRDAHKGMPKIRRHEKATHANGSPATDGKHVVAFFGSEGLHCYSVDGEPLWKVDLGVLDVGPYNAPDLEWGSASSPIIHDGMVIVQCDAKNASFWAAFDVKTGREVRRVKRDDVSTWSTPTICESGGRTQVICNGWKEMGGYDLATGERLWTLQGGGDVPVPTPLVADDRIIITNGHGRSHLYVIRADATGDITPDDDSKPEGIAWWLSKFGSYMPTPMVYGEFLYVGNDNGILAVADVKTGERIYRKRLGSGCATYSASPVAAGGRLYFTSEDGEVHVVKAGREFELLATNSMNEVCMATPAISDGLLLIRTQKHLVAIGE